jgi:hypothetical protein
MSNQFNPDDYLKKSSFDPNAFLKKDSPKATPGVVKSTLLGAADALSFGSEPFVEGVIEGAAALPQGQDKALEVFRAARDQARARNDEAANQHPISYGVGGALAGLASSALIPASGPGRLGALVALMRGESGALNAAKIGATYGAGQSLSRGEGFADTAVRMTKTAALGALGDKILNKAIEFVPKAPEYFLEKANSATLAGLGLTKKQASDLVARDVASGGQEVKKYTSELPEILRTSTKFTSQPVASPFVGGEERAFLAAELKEGSGRAIGETMEKLDQAYFKANPIDARALAAELKQYPDLGIFKDKREATENMQEYLLNAFRSKEKLAAEKKLLSEGIDTTQLDPVPITLSDLQNIKTEVGKDLRSTNEAKAEVARNTYAMLKKKQAELIEGAGDRMSDPTLINQYKDNMKHYEAGLIAEEGALRMAGQALSNKPISLTDTIAGSAALATTHNPTAAVAAVAGNKMLGKLRDIETVSYDTLSKGSRLVNSLIDTEVPKLVEMATQMAASGNPAKERLSRVLMSAAGKDDVGRKATLFAVSQNPGFRYILGYGPEENKD